MRDHDKPNAFDPSFLAKVAEPDLGSLSLKEAEVAGPWRVAEHGDRWGVFQEHDPEPVAVLEFRETAFLLAAVLPIAGRQRLYLPEVSDRGEGWSLETIAGARGLSSVGQVRGVDDEVLSHLDTVEYLLRSPDSLAHFLQAAPAETLEQVGAILADRTL